MQNDDKQREINTSLADIEREIEALCDAIDNCPDQIPMALVESYKTLKLLERSKVDRCGLFNAHLDSSIENFRKMRDLFDKKLKSRIALQERFKDYLKHVCASVRERLPIKGEHFSVTLQKNSVAKLVIDEIEDLRELQEMHPEFVKVKEVLYIDKDAVKRHLEHGLELNWARLEQGEHVRIR